MSFNGYKEPLLLDLILIRVIYDVMRVSKFTNLVENILQHLWHYILI